VASYHNKTRQHAMKTIFLILIILTTALILNSCTKSTSSTQETGLDKKVKNYGYEIVGTKHNTAVDNYFILLKTKDFSEQSVKTAMTEIKSELCTRQCNVCAYDDKTYYDIENEYQDKQTELGRQLGDGRLTQQQWKKANVKLEEKYYVNLADHVVGFIEFEDDGNFSYYPYRDFRYKELGGKLAND
jgi:hypothetical protein